MQINEGISCHLSRMIISVCDASLKVGALRTVKACKKKKKTGPVIMPKFERVSTGWQTDLSHNPGVVFNHIST